MAMQMLGVKKDWEKVHVDDCYKLTSALNGTSIDLPQNLTAVKEYDSITIFKKRHLSLDQVEFKLGTITLGKQTVNIEKIHTFPDLKTGFFVDANKIPKSAVVRFKLEGDLFKKFGGGTKSLSDYFTDKKIPLRLRNDIPLLADGNKILAIFGLAVSDDVKVDHSTENILKLTKEGTL